MKFKEVHKTKEVENNENPSACTLMLLKCTNQHADYACECFKQPAISENMKKTVMLHAGKKRKKKGIKARSKGKETTIQKQTEETKSQQTSLLVRGT